ncbi:unnamed protein product [Bursaphelenchus xylophilus]|uniref:Coiled-coil domain-containing protein 86 n=1 Tax=Bursaphelenchus xylophilus TaxID=6326 RepID=A0A1I7SB24_BURXY|nr:unnamed protein product [Bursaphelenchus xylophilus]CAG9131702.1 unnamed protein product [Bursaphelenchus xylophilus]
MTETQMEVESNEQKEIKTEKLVPTNKSNRWWKNVQKERSSHIVKDRPLHTKWAVKMKKKAELENAKKLQQQIRDNLAQERAEKIAKRKENEERRKANIAKSEIVQVIKNTEKLKRLKKKQLKTIKKMDTTEIAQRTVTE